MAQHEAGVDAVDHLEQENLKAILLEHVATSRAASSALKFMESIRNGSVRPAIVVSPATEELPT